MPGPRVTARIAAVRIAAVGGLAAAAIGMALACWPAPARAADTLRYRILKEDEPIGRETVSLQTDGPRTEVTVTTETRVKVLFLDFHHQHRRQESWVDGHLAHMVADTDDDGEHHHLETRLQDGHLAVTVDGRPHRLPDDALPLTLWGKAILDRSTLYSVIDAAPYPVKVEAVGSEPLTVAGQVLTAQHYRLSGGVDRELWYGPDGFLDKTTFQRRGYPITFIRE